MLLVAAACVGVFVLDYFKLLPAFFYEPLRWLGVNVGLRVMGSADDVEARSGRPALRARAFSRFLG